MSERIASARSLAAPARCMGPVHMVRLDAHGRGWACSIPVAVILASTAVPIGADVHALCSQCELYCLR
jgi:hypothetical protein